MFKLRKNSTILLLCLTSLMGFSQELDLDQLIEFNNMNLETFDFEVSKENFQYFKTMEDDISKSFVYNVLDKNHSTAFLTRSTYKHSEGTYLSYQTTQDIFNKIQEEFVKRGMLFVITQKAEDGNGHFSRYEYKGYSVDFWLAKSSNHNGNIYEITIEKEALK